VAVEQSFVGRNVQSALRLGEARGAIIVAARAAGVTVAEYAPAQIKVAVTGFGLADKGQMQRMVAQILAHDQPLESDEADALGAAICHACVDRFARVVSRATYASRDKLSHRNGQRR
jgi:crossover junction endodeoxyribonuclease RuvC